MRLLVDENVHAVVIRRLRADGFEVEAIAETAAGLSDVEILAMPDIADRVLITYDRDFGELIFKHGMPTPRVLVYSRLGRAEPRHVAERIAEILRRSPEAGCCYVIEKEGERVRPFAMGNMSNG